MNILLITPPWAVLYGEYKLAARNAILYPPLGLYYLTSIAVKRGHNVKVIDAEIQKCDEQTLAKILADFKPAIIGITSSTPCIKTADSIAALCKKYLNVPIIIGGPHISILPEQTLYESMNFDIGVLYEGEETFDEILCNFEKFEKQITTPEVLNNIKGIAYKTQNLKRKMQNSKCRGTEAQRHRGTKDCSMQALACNGGEWGVGSAECKSEIRNPKSKSPNHQIHITEKRQLIQPIDTIPFPVRDIENLDKYSWSIPKKGKQRFSTIITSRGCPYKCIFCSETTMFGSTVRFRTPANVIDEIEYLVNELKIKVLGFVDDTFTLNRNHVLKICKLITEKKIEITLDCWTHAATVDKEILEAMKEAGFIRINIGIESGDKKILKGTKKGVTLEQIINAVVLSKRIGLETCGYAIIGLPDETQETAEKTISFIKNLKYLDYGFITIAAPLPGTEMYEMAKNETHGLQLLTDDFSKYTRYGKPVIEVNNLKQPALIKLQKKGFLTIYLTPRRILYLIRRVSLKDTLTNIFAFIKSMLP